MQMHHKLVTSNGYVPARHPKVLIYTGYNVYSAHVRLVYVGIQPHMYLAAFHAFMYR